VSRRLEDLVEELRRQDIKPIPVEEVRGFLEDDNVSLLLKREYSPRLDEDPLRTVKRKPASFILQDALERGSLKEGRVAISASSGNFAKELAVKANRVGFSVIAVVPPHIPDESVAVLLTLGVDVVKVGEGFNLHTRETTVFLARALAEKHRLTLTNLDQYNSWQNVLSHLAMTWPEILEETGGDLDYVSVPMGSVGTLMGLTLGQTSAGADVEIVGVQPPQVHHMPGVQHIVDGCEWNPEIYCPLFGKEIVTIDDVEAYAALIELWELGFKVGPSTAIGAACARRLAHRLKEGRILTLSADSSFAYHDYVKTFLHEHQREILKRYPHLEEPLERCLSSLSRSESLKERLARVRDVYKPRRDGQLCSAEDLDDERLSQLVKGS